ncbi:MAG: hypothetical protein QOJ75_656 [Chloroflexota bacterium]|jgi:rhodanese-related sulfurtransferase|nr:hypothetical protein [Chloroflexota bacterium]
MTLPGPVASIDVAEAERRLRDDPARPILLDVREPTEFVEVRAPGAVLLPMSELTARLGELPPDRPLMVVCHVGGRSAAAAAYLARTGRADVVNVSGGMDAWAKAGLPVRHGPIDEGEGDLPTA